VIRVFSDRIERNRGSLVEVVGEDAFSQFSDFGAPRETSASESLASGWVGFFGYETAPWADPSFPRRTLSDDYLLGAWGLYDPILIFDHREQSARIASWGLSEALSSEEGLAIDRIRSCEALLEKELKEAHLVPGSIAPLNNLISNFTQKEYEASVSRILDYLKAGDCYQVNLSQRFRCQWKSEEDPLDYFWEKTKAHPSPFSAFLDWGELKLLSFSPEEFLKMQGNHIETRPIKGTRRRLLDPEEDRKVTEELSRSSKDESELLMIVDLARNDLGKICRAGSVVTPRLKETESFNYVHHLVATIRGELRVGVSRMEALRALFPGGSITGAPKKRAMEIIQELEPDPRGIYTGTIGFWDHSSTAFFNIAIRSLEIRNGIASFGVGGGIVAESDPRAGMRKRSPRRGCF
jgi:para-aminobenzoate synthetase component 1